MPYRATNLSVSAWQTSAQSAYTLRKSITIYTAAKCSWFKAQLNRAMMKYNNPWPCRKSQSVAATTQLQQQQLTTIVNNLVNVSVVLKSFFEEKNKYRFNVKLVKPMYEYIKCRNNQHNNPLGITQDVIGKQRSLVLYDIRISAIYLYNNYNYLCDFNEVLHQTRPRLRLRLGLLLSRGVIIVYMCSQGEASGLCPAVSICSPFWCFSGSVCLHKYS